MALTDYMLTFALGGAFVIGLLFIVMRREAQVNIQSGMSAEGLMNQHSGMGFGKAKKNLDRKLASVQEMLRRQNQGDRALAEERFNARRQEQETAEAEARRQRELEAERLRAEQEEALRKEQEEADRRAAERDAEEARLAAEREAERQRELSESEAERLAEIEAAREQEELESREAAQRAMAELKARLEREGAQSSDVQISLMWNNYNDLDLHVVCPSGERIHGGNKTSACGGELDVDANVRAETRKPVENVFWEDGKAPAGKYQVYVHYYKKHKKRRSKDPTKFQVIINQGGDPREYNGELSAGDPIMLVAEFTLASPQERAARRAELEAELRAAGLDVSEATEEAAEAEAARQAALAEAEAERLAEIEAAREQEELESREAAQRAMAELKARLEREGAQSSDVQISLMWNNYNDLDLHVVCPSGERIHGGNKTSACGGELDVDANVRAETRKPVENVFWEDGKAPAGKYQVYVHYYKKHKKRRSKDPTKFQVIINQGGDPREYNGELSAGDPIMLVAEFTLASPQERAARRAELEAELRAAGLDVSEATEEAAEAEAARQAALAEAEAERLAEIEAAREQEELESRQAAQRAMAELKARLEREGAQSSDVQISLMWNNYNDLDLHVVCPSGERIHGGNKTSACGGELDVDANVRAETRKPVENVFWEDGKAPAGTYQVYVHHYKKHDKRRSKDPTKFQVIVNQGSDMREYNGELSAGDPIMLVAEFTLASAEEREARKRELEAEIQRAAGGDHAAPATSTEGEEEPTEPVNDADGNADALPAAPDLDALASDE